MWYGRYGTVYILRPCGLFRCDSLAVRREAGIGQFVFSGRGEWYGCCSTYLLLQGNAISKVVSGVFVVYVVLRSNLILRIVFISVPWHTLWCSWADIIDFAIDGVEFFDGYGGVAYMVGDGMSCCLKIVGSYSCRVDLYRKSHLLFLPRFSCACEPSVLSTPNGISRTVRHTAVVRITCPSSFSF
jgi:hypothetical protein